MLIKNEIILKSQQRFKSEVITIDDQIKNKKLQYDINTEPAKISALSSGKINKYEYLTGKEILPSNQK